GQTHGTSDGGSSGCELMTITVPAGSQTQLLDLKVLGGNGTMTLNLGSAAIKNLAVNENASSIVATLPATLGGSISLATQEAVDTAVTMPSSWAADEVILQADTDKIVNSFTDAKNGAGAGGRGAHGTGLASLKITSTTFAGSTGTITLH